MKTQFGTPALPWQTDDEDPEIEMIRTSGPHIVPKVVVDDDLAVPGGSTLAAVPRSRTPALTAKMRVATADHRKWWLAGAIAAVAIAALSLILVSRGGEPTIAPRASAAPAHVLTKEAPRPLERPTVAVDPSSEPGPAPASAPTKRTTHHHRSSDKPAEKPKKWDPDALFPK
jgi:hypothetical protein